MSSNASNISSSLVPSLNVPWNSSGLVPGLVLSLCFLLGVPGNMAVIVFLVQTHQELSNLSCSLMLNLAVSDVLCLLTPPIWVYAVLYTWNLGLVACKVLTYLVYCSIHGNILTVMLLSIHRYIYVDYTQRRAMLGEAAERGLLVLLWVAVVILSIPSLVDRQLIEGKQWTDCEPVYSSNSQQVAVLLMESLLGFVVPFSVMVSAYICLHRRVNQTAFFNNPKMTRLVTSIIGTFFVLWTPHHVDNMLTVAAVLLGNKSLLEFCLEKSDIVKALTFVNSCLDPLLYAFATRNSFTACSNV